MIRLALAALLFPIALVSSPPKHVVTPGLRAESWVKDALKLATTKGIDVLVKEVAYSEGNHWALRPEVDPVLTVYSGTLKVLAENHSNPHVGMEHTKIRDAEGSPYLVKMMQVAK